MNINSKQTENQAKKQLLNFQTHLPQKLLSLAKKSKNKRWRAKDKDTFP